MKKNSTVAVGRKQSKLTIGLDLGDRTSYYCVLDEAGNVIWERSRCTVLPTIPADMLYKSVQMNTSVLLADDSEIIRKVIADWLLADPEIEVVAECDCFAQAMELASKLHPQVIVLDVHMRDERTVTPSQLKFGLIGSRLLAISIWKDDETKALAERIGATTLLDKANLAITLLPAIKAHANKSSGSDEKSGF